MQTNVRDSVSFEDIGKYYAHDFHCPNCGHRNHKYIQRGVALDSVFFDCDNCGCGIKGKKQWR